MTEASWSFGTEEPLTEEISSREFQRSQAALAMEWSLKDANKGQLRTELPKASLLLRISKDIISEVPEKYKSQLDLPEVLGEETATAVLNKARGVLIITAAAKAGPQLLGTDYATKAQSEDLSW